MVKFRTYVPRTGKWFYWGAGDVNGDGSYFTGPPSDNKAIHCQFSGLYTKEGLEIYEGDIIDIDGFEGLVAAFPFFELYSRVPSGNTTILSGGILGNVIENPELIGE